MTPLRQRMTEDMQVRNLSPHTRSTYLLQVSLFARHFHQSPEALGPEEIRSYQVYPTKEKKLAPSSILIAVSAHASELELEESKHGQELYQSGDETTALMLLISSSAGVLANDTASKITCM